MVEIIVKRDGSEEEFKPNKLNHWAEWATAKLGDRVDWSGAVIGACKRLPGKVSSQALQTALIEEVLDQSSWAAYLMAGRLYASQWHKTVHGNTIPSIKEVQTKMMEAGLITEINNYTDEEYQELEKVINHSLDYEAPHFALEYIRFKYAMRNRVEDIEYETPQFTYMRMAMALGNDRPEETKLKDVKAWYKYFSENKLSAPTPNYENLGAGGGLASCCVYKAGDTINSLAAGDHIAYKMTAASAGIGSYIETRSILDPVRGGKISHNGKLPYYRAMVGQVGANKQGSRGGAGTTHYTMTDPEFETIVRLKNPMTPAAKQIRQLDYSAISNKFIARKAALGEDVFTFNCFTAPDLTQAYFSQDDKEFGRIYENYEKNPFFKKNYVSARDLVLTTLSEGVSTGRQYHFFSDNVNTHTPFKDPIYSSNLCVAPETTLDILEYGQIVRVRIEDKKDQQVTIWNGEEWSDVIVRQTSDRAKLLTVTTDKGKKLDCTEYHKWYIYNRGHLEEVTTSELKEGDVLEKWNDINDELVGDFIKSVEDTGRYDRTFCFTEPKRNKAIFNGILTGNCNEIMLPTEKYESITDLYIAEQDGEIHSKGEVAICSLASTVPTNIESDEEYEDVCYYALLMIDICIHKSKFGIPHVEATARARMSAGVGMMDIAHWFAREGLSFKTLEGRNEHHRLAERHYYFLAEASLRLGKELGNAPWIHKTKWPEGWLPIDTYAKSVDELHTIGLQYNWEDLRSRIIENGGIRNSVLCAYPPSESSSKGKGASNTIYQVRSRVLVKTDNGIVSRWAAVDEDIYKDRYESAYDTSNIDRIYQYAIYQKFTDQGISADFFDKVKEKRLPSSQLLEEYFTMIKYGMKGRYYHNSYTAAETNAMDRVKALADVTAIGEVPETSPALNDPDVLNFDDDFDVDGPACGLGGCTI